MRKSRSSIGPLKRLYIALTKALHGVCPKRHRFSKLCTQYSRPRSYLHLKSFPHHNYPAAAAARESDAAAGSRAINSRFKVPADTMKPWMPGFGLFFLSLPSPSLPPRPFYSDPIFIDSSLSLPIPLSLSLISVRSARSGTLGRPHQDFPKRHASQSPEIRHALGRRFTM